MHSVILSFSQSVKFTQNINVFQEQNLTDWLICFKSLFISCDTSCSLSAMAISNNLH